MITGAHFLFHSTDAVADRAALRDVLGLPSVDAGDGWLIFALPPAELAVHPADPRPGPHGGAAPLLGAVLYLMSDDLASDIGALHARGVTCGPIREADWGRHTTFPLPSGGRVGLYQPRHRTAVGAPPGR